MNVSVMVVVGSLDRGGTEGHLLAVLPRLVRQQPDVKVCVYALRGGGALEPALRAAGIVVHGPARRERGAISLLRSAAGLIATLRRVRPAIVHFFLPQAYLIGAPCSAALPGCRRLMSRRSLNGYQAKYPGVRAIEGALHRRMDAVLGNSGAVCAQLLAEGAPRQRTGLIRNGIEPGIPPDQTRRTAARKHLDLAENATVLVCVANLIAYKGHADLLRALAGAATRIGDDWVLLCIGRDDGLGTVLHALAGQLGLAARIRWLGETPDVATPLAAADIGVLASHEEGSSNALLEFMAAGLAVVATNVGGNAEALDDGRAGLLVPAGAPAALGDAIARLTEDRAERVRLAAVATRRVRREYGLARCVELYARLYRNLASEMDSPIPIGARLPATSGAGAAARGAHDDEGPG